MIRLLTHVLVEYGPDREARIDAAVAAILDAIPEARLDVAPGLLDDDLLIEVRIPLSRLHDWPEVARRVQAHRPAGP
ncbi:hypothetical protein [Methylobacterium isbiliense]|jgi:hypothetical protein|uniref:Uncharacterized protein n=1 Tax=Methylobacterium isbiliense TaxID=315478 RepID=A0ABQ4S8J0_9HYPH|nr:hypothetical protein [Methylobacterium isbiliense]MDN3622923.1 hypothetical protein [Methylobacterium isbiliense]GJD98794.1 hypothetical protein GMJLKIPL_0705 [Methylobacterium isbiliense]